MRASIQDYFSKIERIGRGSYSEVYRAIPVHSHESDPEGSPYVALKKSTASADSGIKYTSIREIMLLKSLNFNHIVKLKEVYYFAGDTYLVLEYVEYHLMDFRSKLPLPIDPAVIKSLMYQLFMAVSFIHSCNIIHRDLKPQNILVTRKGLLKVADFGLSRFYHEHNLSLTPRMVTVLYRAPELLLDWENYTTAVDVWSCGCVFAEFINGKPLFYDTNDPRAPLEKIFRTLGLPRNWPVNDHRLTAWPSRGDYPNQPDWAALLPGIDDVGRDLLSKCLALNPEERISASDALAHPYFHQMRNG